MRRNRIFNTKAVEKAPIIEINLDELARFAPNVFALGVVCFALDEHLALLAVLVFITHAQKLHQADKLIYRAIIMLDMAFDLPKTSKV